MTTSVGNFCKQDLDIAIYFLKFFIEFFLLKTPHKLKKAIHALYQRIVNQKSIHN